MILNLNVYLLIALINILFFFIKSDKINIFKNVVSLLAIYVNIVFILQFNKNYIFLFLIGIYIAIKNLLDVLEETFSYNDKFLKYLIWIISPYYLLKEKFIFRDLLENNKNFKSYIFVLSSLILIVSLLKNKEKLKNYFEKNKKNKEVFRARFLEILEVTFPFYLLKDGGLKTYPVLIVLVIINLKKEKIIKNIGKYKYIYLSLLIYSIICTLSFLLNKNMSETGNEYLKKVWLLAIYIIVLLNGIWNEKILKKAIAIFIYSSFFTILSVIIQFTKNNYLWIRYSDGYLIIPFGIKCGIIATIVFYYILKEKKYEIIPYFIVSIFGIFLSGSRGPFVSIILVLIFMMIVVLKNSLQKLLLSLIFIMVFLVEIIPENNNILKRLEFAKSGRDGSTITRMYIYKESIRQFIDKPILGNSLGNYQEIAKKFYKTKENDIRKNNMNKWYAIFYHTYSHNNILGLVSGIGIFGFLSYVAVQLIFLKNFIKKSSCLLGISLMLIFELNGITDMTIIFYRIQQILMFIYILILNDKENLESN